MRLNSSSETGTAGTNYHHIVIDRRIRVAPFLNHILFAGGRQRTRHRFFQRLALRSGPGNRIHVRTVCDQNALAQAVKRAGEVNIQRRIRHQFNVSDTIGIQRDVDFQLQRFRLYLRLIHPGFIFTMAVADVADHGVHQREAPERFRNCQRLTFGAVDVEFKVFIINNAIGPVGPGDTGFPDGNQIEARFQRQLGILFIHHAADANNRNARQLSRALRNIFGNQRRRVAGVDNGRTQQLTNGEVHVIKATRGQFLQQIKCVIPADTGHLNLFR